MFDLKLRDINIKTEITEPNTKEYEDVVELLAGITEVFSDIGLEFTFEVLEESWDVDVYLDLLVLLEQIPAFNRAISSENYEQFDLRFYEQGLQRILTFTKKEKAVIITCVSLSDWKPKREYETIKLFDLRKTIENFKNQFSALTNKYCPDHAKHRLFEEWLVNE